MTCTIEQLKASGLAFGPSDFSGITGRYLNLFANKINKILCEKLIYTEYNDKTFTLCTLSKPIPPPKTVEVSEQMIDEICREYYCVKNYGEKPPLIFNEYLKLKLFGEVSK